MSRIATRSSGYTASLDDVMVALDGKSMLGQVRDDTSYMSDFAPTSASKHGAIEKVVDMSKECGKCEKVCPQHLKIRDLLADVADEFENRRFG